jgi:hypothetical protein
MIRRKSCTPVVALFSANAAAVVTRLIWHIHRRHGFTRAALLGRGPVGYD